MACPKVSLRETGGLQQETATPPWAALEGETVSKRTPASCTIVVCTRNRPEHLERCLAAVSRQNYPSYEVLVVDNASDGDQTRNVALKYNTRYVVEGVVGLSRARNQGLAHSRGEIVAYIDDDAVPEPDWLSCLLEGFSAPEVMAVTGRVFLPVNANLAKYRMHPFTSPEAPTAESSTLDSRMPGWFDRVNFRGLGIGANMAFRRAALEKLGGFDVRLGRSAPLKGCEETYAFFSLISRGYQVAYACRAVVHHPWGATETEMWARRMADLYAAAAYAAFLFFEEPDYRGATLDCVARRVRRNFGRVNGKGNGDGMMMRNDLFPRRRVLLAMASGPFLYLRSLFTQFP